MAKFTVEWWRCDRCHQEDERWLKPGSAHSIRASVDYGTAGGPIIEWAELCVPCNETVSKELEAMKASALAARRAKETSSGDD